MKKLLLFLIALPLLFLSACEEDDPEPTQKIVQANGLTDDINALVPADLLEEMEDMGMPINRGNFPPDVSGTYLGSKIIMINTNEVENPYPIGFKFPDFKFEFFEFNKFDLTLKMSYINSFERGTAIGYIVGEGNKFSVFAQTVSELESQEAYFLYVLSGEVSSDGIVDFHFANFMLDNQDDPNDVWIENGEGRVSYDQDGLSEPIDPLDI